MTTVCFDISGLELFLPLTCGARVVVASAEEARDPSALAALVRRFDVDVLQATPASWRLLVANGWMGAPDSVVALCGGEALPADLAGQLRPRVRRLLNVYGPTECTIWSTRHEVEALLPLSRRMCWTTVPQQHGARRRFQLEGSCRWACPASWRWVALD